MKNKRTLFYLCLFAAALFLPLDSCDLFDDGGGSVNDSVTVTVSPASVTLARGTTQKFEAEVTGSYSSSVTWSVEGNSSPGTAIARDGLLAVADNENSRTLTVKATWSSYDGDTASGTAVVTVATDAEIPSNLKITKPDKTGLPISWSVVTNASSYKVYRSINGKDYPYLGDSSDASYTDTTVVAGSYYYYAVSAVVNGLETGKSAVVFGFAEQYFALPALANRRLVPLVANQKHYYRFPVTSGGSYTLTWQNGSNANVNSDIRVSAWQNDGTAIFTGEWSGHTSPKAFTATAAGYVTVEVNNGSGSARYNYMVYCYGISGENNDAGIVALPPAMVTGIKVTSPSASSITLGWDPVPDAVSYNIYHSPSQTAAPGKIGSSTSASFTDTAVSGGVNYYYTIAPVNADGKEGVWVQGAFACAASHYALPSYSSPQTTNLYPNTKHYYRLAVNTGQWITITWQNGSNANVNSDIRVSAWQNDGTAIFTGEWSGYTSPKAFTVTGAGYVTVEVNNNSGSTGYNYQIYYSN
jgi:hypothetical protein